MIRLRANETEKGSSCGVAASCWLLTKQPPSIHENHETRSDLHLPPWIPCAWRLIDDDTTSILAPRSAKKEATVVPAKAVTSTIVRIKAKRNLDPNQNDNHQSEFLLERGGHWLTTTLYHSWTTTPRRQSVLLRSTRRKGSRMRRTPAKIAIDLFGIGMRMVSYHISNSSMIVSSWSRVSRRPNNKRSESDDERRLAFRRTTTNHRRWPQRCCPFVWPSRRAVLCSNKWNFGNSTRSSVFL